MDGLSVIQQSLCLCQSYLVLSVHYHSLFFLIRVKTNIGESGQHLRLCVFPCRASLQVGIHKVCVLSAWEQNTQSQLLRELIARITRAFATTYVLLSEGSLEREPLPALLAVPALLSLRRARLDTSETRHSTCLHRWMWRMSMSFRKAYCLHKHIVCTSTL